MLGGLYFGQTYLGGYPIYYLPLEIGQVTTAVVLSALESYTASGDISSTVSIAFAVSVNEDGTSTIVAVTTGSDAIAETALLSTVASYLDQVVLSTDGSVTSIGQHLVVASINAQDSVTTVAVIQGLDASADTGALSTIVAATLANESFYEPGALSTVASYATVVVLSVTQDLTTIAVPVAGAISLSQDALVTTIASLLDVISLAADGQATTVAALTAVWRVVYFTISGVAYNSLGTIVVDDADVIVFRDDSNVPVATTVTDVDGEWVTEVAEALTYWVSYWKGTRPPGDTSSNIGWRTDIGLSPDLILVDSGT